MEHFATRNIRNPFQNYVFLDTRFKAKVAFMSLFVAPIRLALISVVLVAAYVVSLAVLWDFNSKEPLKGWRRSGKDMVAQLMVYAHVIGGFRVKIKGKRAKPWEAPILVVAPHSSHFDAMPFCVIGAPSVVGKADLVDTPLIGKMLLLTQPILFSRDCPNARKATIDLIRERVEHILATKDNPEESWSQVLIFPEATCTNRSSLISFKPGAFCPGLPVQPICLHWGPDNPVWVHILDPPYCSFNSFWYTLCRVENTLLIEYLPVYYPSTDDTADAYTYANNVRSLMAEHLKLPTSDYSIDDALYLTEWYRPKHAKFWNVCDKMKVDAKQSCDLLQLQLAWDQIKNDLRFRQLDFEVSFKEFAKFVGVASVVNSSSSSPIRLFNMFDWRCTGYIDLREYLLCRHSSSCANQVNFWKLAFSMFSIVDEEAFIKIMRFPGGLSVRECRKLFRSIAHSSMSNHVTFDTFFDYCVKSPLEESKISLTA